MNRRHTHPKVASRPALPIRLGRGSRLCVALSLLATVALALPSAADSSSPFLEYTFLAYSGRGDVPFDNPSGLAVNPRGGEYAVTNTGRGRIEILDTNGHSIGYFAHYVRRADGTAVLGQPSRLCYTARGELLVVDNSDRDIDVLAPGGRSIAHLQLPATPPAVGRPGFDSAAGAMARLHDGTLLVASRGNPAHVWRLDADGRPLGDWGVPGEGPGKLSGVTALAEAPSGEIVVTCAGTELAIQRFDSTGAYIAGFSRHELGPGNSSLPSGIAITPNGRMWVSDELRQCVQVFDREGRYLGLAGGGGPDLGSFVFPSDVQNDGAGILLVLDRVAARLQGFRILNDMSAFNAPERR